MKIRSGFVSNSSSSSFILILEEKNFDTEYNNASRLEKALLDFISHEKIKAFGKDLVQISFGCGNASPFENADIDFDFDLTEEEEEQVENQGYNVILDELVGKMADKYESITHEQDL